MGTRSRIAVQRDDHFESIYCHWDGYLSGAGKTLIEHYTDPAKVDALLALGDCSSLGEHVRKPSGLAVDFDDRDEKREGATLAYRDRGEDVPAQRSSDLDALLKIGDDCGVEYVYVFSDGVWLATWHGKFRAFGCGPDADKGDAGSPWLSLVTVEQGLIAESIVNT